MMRKFFLSNKLVNSIIFIIFISLVITLFNSNIEQRAVNASLYLSETVVTSGDSSLLNLVFSNSYTSIYQILTILIKLGFSPEKLNFLILFLSTSINLVGIFLISRALLKNDIFALSIAIFLIITQFNIGDLDYPVLILSEHSNGMLGSSLPVLIFGLVGNRFFRTAIICCLINISIHVVIGLWITFLLLLFIFVYKENFIISFKNNKSNIFIFPLVFFLFLVSIVYYQVSKIPIPFEYDYNLFNTYMLYWELHRSNIIPINYRYISLSILIIFFAFLYIIKNKNNSNKYTSILMLRILIAHICLSFIIYFSYKIFPNIFHEKIVKVMPSRLFLIHSYLGMSVLVSLTFYFLLNIFSNKKFLLFFLILLILIHPTIFYKKYLKKINSIHLNLITKNEEYDKSFWKTIEREKFDNGYFLTSSDICSKTIQKSKKPLLICIESIDYLPYIPNLILPLNQIIEEVFEIKFDNPPEKNHGGLWYENSYKKIFEDRSRENWLKISKKFNLNGLIFPSSWKLNLDKTLIGKNYTYYRF